MSSITSFFSSGTGLITGVVFLVLVLFITVVTFVKYRRKVAPNTALFVYGKKAKKNDQGLIIGGRVITAGGTWVNPFLEATGEIPLELMTIVTPKDQVMTVNGVPIEIDWTAQVKIGQDEQSIRTAATMFLDKSEEQIKQQVAYTFSGNVREVISTLTVEEVHRDREKLTSNVRRIIADEMAAMGMTPISFSITDMRDDQEYFQSLAAKDIANVKKEAVKAQAIADKEARQAKAQNELAAKNEELRVAEEIAIKENTLRLKQAELKQISDTKQADADMAKNMRELEIQKDLTERQVAVELMKEERLTDVAKQAAIRAEETLQATVRKPADAEAYRIKQLAEAELVKSQNQANSNKALALAEADGTKAKLEATADGKKADLLAEATGKQKLAEALNAYEDAALRLTVAQQFIQQMPAMVEALATQFAKIGDIKIIDLGGSSKDGGNLIEKFANTAPQALLKFSQVLQATTGIDVLKLLGGDTAGQATPEKTKKSEKKD